MMTGFRWQASPPSAVRSASASSQRSGNTRPGCAYGIVSVALFGSAARGESRPGSDVDILVEIDHLKANRSVATRYDKLADSFLGMLYLATIKLWIEFVHRT